MIINYLFFVTKIPNIFKNVSNSYSLFSNTRCQNLKCFIIRNLAGHVVARQTMKIKHQIANLLSSLYPNTNSALSVKGLFHGIRFTTSGNRNKTSSCLSYQYVHSQMLQKRLLWNLLELKRIFNLENSRPDLHSLLDLLLVYHIVTSVWNIWKFIVNATRKDKWENHASVVFLVKMYLECLLHKF